MLKKNLLFLFLATGVLSAFQAANLNIPCQEDAPAVEQIAKSDAHFWSKAVAVSGMTEFTSGNAPQWNTRVAFSATSQYLYLQICADKAPGVPLVANETKRDGRVYFDDCLEVAVAKPGSPAENYFQFSLNSANVLFDACNADASWNSHATSTVVVEDTRWIATLRIPFADLGYAAMPEHLQCNVARTVLAPASEQSVMVRSSTSLFFGNLAQAISLHFGGNLPAGAFEIVPMDSGNTILRCRALALPPEKFADFQLKITDAAGKEVFSKKSQSRFDSLQSEIEVPRLEDGKYRCSLQMLQARQNIIPAYYGGGVEDNPRLKEGQSPEVYMDWHWPVTIDNAAKLELSAHLKNEGRTLCASLLPIALETSGNAKYRIFLQTPQGKTLEAFPAFPCKGEKQSHQWDISRLPPRSRFLLKAELWDGDACQLEATCAFATPPKPEWKNAVLPERPDNRKVPAPWTPVEFSGLETSCWGRRFQFQKDSPVPMQIFSQEIPLLAQPARIVAEPAISWKLLSARKLHASGVRYEYQGKCADGAQVTAFTEVYFDGVVRTDIALPPNRVFSKLYLEIPCRREIAAFLHHGPGQFGGMFNIRKCEKKEDFSILPNAILLNDQVGLGWFDGMQFDWPLAAPQRAVEILPGEKQTVLRVNYLDQAKSYPRQRTFSWGLQALPVRPLPEKEEGMRMCYSVRYGDEKRTAWLSTVDYVAQGNIQLDQGALEFKFRIPKCGKEEPLMVISHGEAAQVRLFVAPDGRLTAYGHQYYAAQWRLQSQDTVTPGDWHCLGLNWGNGKIELWLDGRKNAEVPAAQLMRLFPTILSVGGLHCSIDELRISSAPRQGFSMEKPDVDRDTLLCDCFDRQGYANGRRATIPEKIAEDADAGYLLPDTKLETGLRGLAVAPMRAPLRSLIQGYAAMGFQMMCFHASQYTDEAMAGLYIKDEQAFRSSLKAIHDAGMKAILYTGNGLSNFDRSWDTYASKWLIEPRGTPFIQSWIPDEKSYQACPRSGYTDYFFWRIGRLMDEYGVDGIFLDGRMAAQCHNTLHGCEAENFDGKKVSKRDPWDARWRSQFLYNVVQSRHGYAEQHKSGNWNIPDCFYWNGVWEGEQLMGVKRNGRKRLEVCPLEAMRGEINGIPFGMPSRNTAYTGSPFTPVEYCTFSFVHGTPWTMTYRPEEGLVVSPYWLAMEKFGADRRNFRGYWAQRPPAKQTCHELLKVSAHIRPGKVLLIVANFNEDAARTAGNIILDLPGLGLKHPRMTDAFSGEAVPLRDDGTFQVDLKCFRQKWYLLEE